MEWLLKHFNDLSVHELYAIIRLRNEVFVVEQQCVFQDADDKDQLCWHFMGWENKQLLAYTRIAPPGVMYDQPSIGRVITAVQARGNGTGKTLMKESLAALNKLCGNTPVKIGAQLYLKKFYTSIGFQQCGEMYLEDGIEHIPMIYP